MLATLHPPLNVMPSRPAAQRWLPVRHTKLDATAGLAVVGLLIWRLATAPDPVSGPDGGNWLALSANLVGQQVKAASTVYPPLLLGLLLLVEVVLRPLDALRVVGVLAGVAPAVGLYVALRLIGLRSEALLAAVGLAVSGFTQEMSAWGGYPQLLGTGCALAGMGLVVTGATRQSRWLLAGGGAAGGAAILANQLSGFQAGLGIFVAYTVWGLAAQPGWAVVAKGALFVGAGALAAALPGIPAYLGLRAGMTPAFNVNAFVDHRESAGYLLGEGMLLWAALFALIIPAGVAAVRQREWSVASVGAALVGVGPGLFLLTNEVRALYLTQAASLLALGVVLRNSASAPASPRMRMALWVSTAALVAAIGLVGFQRFETASRFYGVLDPHVVEGLEWLSGRVRPGDLAASAPARRNWCIGWWVEGLGRVPTYIECDPRWLAFHDEKEHAEIARAIFSQADAQEAAAEAQRQGITLLVIDTRENGKADQWLRSGRVFGSIGLVYSNPSLAIFRVARPDGP